MYSIFVRLAAILISIVVSGIPGFDPLVGRQHALLGFPGGSEFTCNAGDAGSFPCRRKWQPTPVFLPGKSRGQRSLVGYSPRGRKESGVTDATKVSLANGPHNWRIKFSSSLKEGKLFVVDPHDLSIISVCVRVCLNAPATVRDTWPSRD